MKNRLTLFNNISFAREGRVSKQTSIPEIGSDHLDKLDGFTGRIRRERLIPPCGNGDFGGQSEKGRQEIGDGEMEEEKVHPSNLPWPKIIDISPYVVISLIMD